MTISPMLPSGFELHISEAELESLVIALELAIAVRRNDPDRGILVAAVDADALNDLADRLVAA